jgi:hypothetical protein
MTSPCCGPEVFGADPITIKWQIVRGDTAPLRVEFYQDDEVTLYDTTGWEYAASAYDFKGDTIDELEVAPGEGYVEITATPEITQYWGTGYRSIVSELAFDLQVTIDGDTVWTPVIGTITVLGDVTGGSL